MIRLTELECTDGTAVVRIEGNLTADTLLVLGQALEEYQQRGIGAVNLAADGVISIDRLALEAWTEKRPPDPSLCFLTSRVALHQLLEGCGVKAALQ
jgi:hypothetical protein